MRSRPHGRRTWLEGLFAASCGEGFALGDRSVEPYDPEARIWRYMAAGPFATRGALGAWLATQDAAEDGRPFVVRDAPTGTPLGVANLIANQPQHLKIELGSIWYGPIAQGTGNLGGPIMAHFTINFVNLRYIVRPTAAERRSRPVPARD